MRLDSGRTIDEELCVLNKLRRWALRERREADRCRYERAIEELWARQDRARRVVAVTEPDAGVTVEMGLAVFESVNADLDELDQVRELEVDQELTIGGGAAPLFVVRRIA